MKHLLIWGFVATGLVGVANLSHAQEPQDTYTAHSSTVVLLTHPRASVLNHIVSLVRAGALNIDHLQVVGVHHVSETEDYSDAQAYLTKEHITWISLRTIQCSLHQQDVFENNGCRREFADLVAHSSGIILNGGADIPPALYNRPTKLTTIIETPHRHYFEVSFLAHLLGTARNTKLIPLLRSRPDYAVFGICVGMQSLNVADGGTLVQDIPSEIYGLSTIEEIEHSSAATRHRSTTSALEPEPSVNSGVFHPIRLTLQAPRALRLVLVNAPYTAQVLSLHHQAVGNLGPHYVVTATSLDGKVVEGIRHKLFANVVGWQFHPERSPLWNGLEEARVRPDAPDHNFAFTMMQTDPHAKTFSLAIWQQFAQAVAASAQHQAPLATH